MSENVTPFRNGCEHVLQRLPAIDMTVQYGCSECDGVQDFTTEFLNTPNYTALISAVIAELGGTVAGVRTEPRRREYPVGAALPPLIGADEVQAMKTLSDAGIGFVEYLDAWVDKGIADGTLTIEKAARYREAIARRCAELGEVPHRRENIHVLSLKAGDILGIVSPSDSVHLMGQMARYTREILEQVGAEGTEVIVFPPGTEFYVLEGAAAQVSDKVRQFVADQIADVALTQERFRTMLAEEIRLNAAMGRTH